MESLERDEALEILEAAPVAHLGVVFEGKPYVTPMSFVLFEGKILFRTVSGRKLEALLANPEVCIEASRFDEETGDWFSVIVEGRASLVDADDVKQNTVALLLRKYEKVMGSLLSSGGIRPLDGTPHYVEVEMETVTGMSSGRGFSSRTRPGRL